MEDPKKQLLERLKSANNVLVTVSTNPSVDQLSAAIGLTLMLNKMDKHATAVFSGEVPSTIEFLQPEKTIEKNTDSLRDFIIALDKSKADKLRYKVEDSHVKIFITPYRTSITEADLDFSQGDFNVEVVVALGVTEQHELDKAITAHGRILHDATTVSVTTGAQSSLGAINWAGSGASSLCEMVASLANDLQPNLLDGQMATALMTGIVSETDRFSNDKTASSTMSISAALMSAGANQQLVASKLQEKPAEAVQTPATNGPHDGQAASEQVASDGSLSIDHDTPAEPDQNAELPQIEDTPEEMPDEPLEQIQIDENGMVQNENEPEQSDTNDNPPDQTEESDGQSVVQGGSPLILEPPTLGGKLTANAEPEHLDPSTDPLAGGHHDGPLLSHQQPPDDKPAPEPAPVLDVPTNSVPPESSDVPLPEPDMNLPSENEQPVVTSLPTPSEQSIQLPPAPEPVPTPEPKTEPEPAVPEESPVQTLSDLEAAVHAAAEPTPEPPAAESVPEPSAPEPEPAPEPVVLPELTTPAPEETPVTPPVESLDSARDAVSDALASMQNQPLPPIDALNAQPLDLEIKQTGETGVIDNAPLAMPEGAEFTMPENLVPDTGLPVDATAPLASDPAAPPTVPPPFMPDMNGFSAPEPPAPDNAAQQQASQQNPFGLPPA